MHQDHYQTMRLSFEEICQGQTPWVPLGNFMNDWYANHFHEREQLIIDPLSEIYPQQYHQWEAFCAASVRWFCATYEIPCPSWVDDPRYVLSEPWYLDHPPSRWQTDREETAPEFRHHNIYCGNRVYTNKYERNEQNRLFGSHPVDLQERRALVRKAHTRLTREWAERDRLIQEYLPKALALREAARKRKQTVTQ